MVRHGSAIGSSAMPNGVSGADICRKHGVSDATLYRWKAKYGGMDVSEAKRLKGFEDENARPKRLLANAMLDRAIVVPWFKPNGEGRVERFT
jgi:putative transposase